jgi:AP-3 complex subunit delta-1
MTPDLARDVANDLVTRLSSAKPYVRKKATLITYKLFLSYPEALRPTFPRLKERLEDADIGVQVCWRRSFEDVLSDLPRLPLSTLSVSWPVATRRTICPLRPSSSRLFPYVLLPL